MVKGERIVGLDIGTTKICAIVAEVDDLDHLKITGVGSSPSEGLKRIRNNETLSTGGSVCRRQAMASSSVIPTKYLTPRFLSRPFHPLCF